MKKQIIGAIVGGIVLFGWQFLTWGPLNLHEAQQKYTPKQDTILSYLTSQFSEDGAYMMPTFKPGTPRDEMEKEMKAREGKPWASVIYHKEMPGMSKMFMNMGRSLLVDMFAVFLLCWLLTKITMPSFSTILIGCLGTGLIVFLTSPYLMHIWYGSFDIMAHFADNMISWGITGIWLGWWLRRK